MNIYLLNKDKTLICKIVQLELHDACHAKILKTFDNNYSIGKIQRFKPSECILSYSIEELEKIVTFQ